MNVGDKVHLGFGVKGGAGFEGTVIKIEGETVTIKNPEGRTFTGPLKNVTVSNSFQNGVAKAEQEIMNKASQVGVKLKNAPGKLVEKYKGYGIRDYGSGNFVIWTSDGEGFAETGKKSIDEAKAWIDSHPHPKFHPGTRHSEGN